MSDEAPGCSPCNKTYVGEAGGWYTLSVPRPRGDKLPFTCFLTLSAQKKEKVQVTLQDFRLGRFQSHIHNGCPDGHLQITEAKAEALPPPGSGSGSGQFCGITNNKTRPSYLSTTNTVTLTVQFFQFWADNLDNSFLFSLRYRILPYIKRSAMSDVTQFLGRLVPNSQCDYKLDNCSQRKCLVRSPHYPGLYPRNLTCSYHIFVLPGEVPSGKQALVSVSQPQSGRVWLEADEVEKYGQVDMSLGLWSECENVNDHVTAYDGPGLPGTAPPSPLIVFCRGGVVPQIVSSGPDMLVVFRTSPFSVPKVSPYSLNGFELEVDIKFVDIESESYVPKDRTTGAPECQFSFSSVARQSGVVESIHHGLASNQTCTWQFQALPGEVVWISFQKFQTSHHKPDIYRTDSCSNKLSLMDGPPFLTYNGSLIGEFCDTSPPLICDHAALGEKMSRPCSPGIESYVSKGRGLTLSEIVGQSTVVNRLEFVARYEFVTIAQDGLPVNENRQSCDREFKSDQVGGRYNTQDYAFATPRNVFLFGRGGRENISCTFKLIGSPTQRIQVKFTNISVGDRPCKTVFDPSIARYRCDFGGSPEAGVFLTEVVGEEEQYQQCHCQVMHNTQITSVNNVLVVKFKATKMLPTQDFRDFSLQGSFRFINTHCHDETAVKRGGFVTLDYHSSEQAICDKKSWSIRARNGREIHLDFPGVLMPQNSASQTAPACATRSRVVVRIAGKIFIICPVPAEHTVKLSSSRANWTSNINTHLQSVSVHLAGQSTGLVTFSWLELTPDPSQSGLSGSPSPLPLGCEHPCPSLQGCISSDLWCDGKRNCPSGWDESERNCSHLLIPIHYLYFVAAGAVFLFIVTAIIVVCRLRSCQKTEHEVAKRVSNGTVETMLNHKEEVS